MSKKANSNLISALIYIIIGVLFIVFKGGMLNVAMTIAGIVFIVLGVLDVIAKNWTNGAVSLVIGVALLIFGNLLTNVVLIVFGVLIAIKGLLSLIDELKKKNKSTYGIIFAVLTIIVGFLLAFGRGLDIIIVVCGVVFLVDGVLGLASALKK